MIVIRLIGGLGNQMFQYALGRSLARKNNTVFKIDTTLLLDHSQPDEVITHRKLDIDIFNVTIEYASPEEIEYFNGKRYPSITGKIYNKIRWQFRKKNLVIENKGRKFDPKILKLGNNKCLVGSWQNEKYFKNIEQDIRKEFQFKEPLKGKAMELGKQISDSNSLCINIRRGDYITSPIYSKTLGTMPIEYFKNGFELIRSKNKIDAVFIFSDDIEWCKQNLHFDNSIFVGHEYAGPKFSTYLQLMTHCKHFIIPNSTFGWWGAWLGDSPGKMVIAPKQWYRTSKFDSTSIVPESWIRI